MGLINKTISFSLEGDFHYRTLKNRYQNKLNKLTDKRDLHQDKAEMGEAQGGLFGRLKATHQYRKADKAQRKINTIHKNIARAAERRSRNAIDPNEE